MIKCWFVATFLTTLFAKQIVLIYEGIMTFALMSDDVIMFRLVESFCRQNSVSNEMLAKNDANHWTDIFVKL